MELKTFQNNALNYSDRGRNISIFITTAISFVVFYYCFQFLDFDFKKHTSWGGNTGNFAGAVVMTMVFTFFSLLFFTFVRFNRGGIIPKFLFIQPTGTELSEYFIWRRNSLSQRLRELDKKPVDDKFFKEIKKVNAEFSELMRYNQYVPEEEEIIEPVRKKKKRKRKPRPPHQTKRWKK